MDEFGLKRNIFPETKPVACVTQSMSPQEDEKDDKVPSSTLNLIYKFAPNHASWRYFSPPLSFFDTRPIVRDSRANSNHATFTDHSPVLFVILAKSGYYQPNRNCL